MPKIVFDADALIKLARAGILPQVTGAFDCHATRVVQREAVDAGKAKMYEDALRIEDEIGRGRIRVHAISAPKTEESGELGTGELTALSLFARIGADAIASDDRKFLSKLERDGIPFVTPTQLLVALWKSGKISRKSAARGLEGLRHFVPEHSYKNALNQIGGIEQ
ncbi:hypothetical protein HY095_00885 [Candidatus Micrarchaeota archaeon]|nr:hypothetical protein [Candidatus Micrarchaeota archaeon]